MKQLFGKISLEQCTKVDKMNFVKSRQRNGCKIMYVLRPATKGFQNSRFGNFNAFMS